MNRHEIKEYAMKNFPKGSLVMTPSGEIFTVAVKTKHTPREDDWYEGIYYHGGDFNEVLCAMGDGESRGYHLYDRGKWAKKLDIQELNAQQNRLKELEGALNFLLDTKEMKENQGKTETYLNNREEAWQRARTLLNR